MQQVDRCASLKHISRCYESRHHICRPNCECHFPPVFQLSLNQFIQICPCLSVTCQFLFLFPFLSRSHVFLSLENHVFIPQSNGSTTSIDIPSSVAFQYELRFAKTRVKLQHFILSLSVIKLSQYATISFRLLR